MHTHKLTVLTVAKEFGEKTRNFS